MTCKQYMFLENNLPRKTFLTAEEEEELIRRLYICPRLNLFPPKLYEDLPSLKFWNSPAYDIECYLKRKVFQKRLQMAYEFNQNKEAHEQSVQHDAAEETPDQLTKAVNQLTDDISYFTHFIPPYSYESIKIDDRGDRNRYLWNEIRPIEVFTAPERKTIGNDVIRDSINETKTKLQADIRKRFSNFKNFYVLQNLTSDDKPPLTLTIDKPTKVHEESSSYEENSLKTQETAPLKGKKVSVTSSKGLFVAQSVDFSDYSEAYEEKIELNEKLPKLQSVSECNLVNPTNIQKILQNVRPVNDDMDSLLPQLPLHNMNKSFIRKGTLLTLRDSVELAHKRMSLKPSKLSLPSDFSEHPQPQLHKAKDSFMMLSEKLPKAHQDNSTGSIHSIDSFFCDYSKTISPTKTGHRSTIAGHQDSLLLALQNISSKEKANGELSCDICHNRESKSIQFLCEFHAANSQSSNQQSPKSIISKTKSVLSHRDSVVVAKKKGSLKDNRKSVACQVNNINICEGLPHFKDGVTKGSKMSKQREELVNNDIAQKTTPKLKNYLMSAVQINRVSTLNKSSSK